MTTEDKRQPSLTDLDPMPFGKYKGTLMQDVSASYLAWLKAELDKESFIQSAKGGPETHPFYLQKIKLYNYIHNSWDAIKMELGKDKD